MSERVLNLVEIRSDNEADRVMHEVHGWINGDDEKFLDYEVAGVYYTSIYEFLIDDFTYIAEMVNYLKKYYGERAFEWVCDNLYFNDEEQKELEKALMNLKK